MKKVLMAILFVMPVLAWAEKPNPSDYAVKVHVQSSRIALECGAVNGGGNFCNWEQHLNVVIDGRKFELVGPTTSKKMYSAPGPTAVLHVGDYKARELNVVNSSAYEYSLELELLFPDGSTRKYSVIGESE